MPRTTVVVTDRTTGEELRRYDYRLPRFVDARSATEIQILKLTGGFGLSHRINLKWSRTSVDLKGECFVVARNERRQVRVITQARY